MLLGFLNSATFEIKLKNFYFLFTVTYTYTYTEYSIFSRQSPLAGAVAGARFLSLLARILSSPTGVNLPLPNSTRALIRLRTICFKKPSAANLHTISLSGKDPWATFIQYTVRVECLTWVPTFSNAAKSCFPSKICLFRYIFSRSKCLTCQAKGPL